MSHRLCRIHLSLFSISNLSFYKTQVLLFSFLLNAGCTLCDNDGDGELSDAVGCFGDDCNDSDRSVGPGAFEDIRDGIDNDCDGRTDETLHCDLDEDGMFSLECYGGDCDDQDPRVFAGALENPFTPANEDCNPRTGGQEIDCEALPIAPRVERDGRAFQDCRGAGPDVFGQYEPELLPYPIRIPVIAHVFHDPRVLHGERRRFKADIQQNAQEQIQLKIEKTLERTNEMFAPIRTSFFLQEVRFAQDDDLAYADLAPGDEFESMRRQHFVEDAVNLFYVSRVNAGDPTHSWAGHSSGPHAQVQHIIMELKDYSFKEVSNIHAHELGHLFDLNHTHETRYGRSLVNTPNDHLRGDRIPDTAADPGRGLKIYHILSGSGGEGADVICHCDEQPTTDTDKRRVL